MKFKQGLEHVPVGQYAAPKLIRIGRWYPCCICNTRTDWYVELDVCPPVPICSDECKDELDDQQAEVAATGGE